MTRDEIITYIANRLARTYENNPAIADLNAIVTAMTPQERKSLLRFLLSEYTPVKDRMAELHLARAQSRAMDMMSDDTLTLTDLQEFL